MSTFVRDLPISRKLNLLVIVASAISLALAALGLIALDLVLVKNSLTRDLQTQARVIANTSNAMIWLGAAFDQQEMVDILSTNPNVIEGAIFDTKGEPIEFVIENFDTSVADTSVAVYQRDKAKPFTKPEKPWKNGFLGRSLVVYEPITYQSEGRTEFLGTVFIRADLDGLVKQVGLHVMFMGIVFLFSFGLAYLVSQRFQHLIAGPIKGLAGKAAEISKSGDYSLRQPRTSKDEIGDLTDSFNSMLTTIQSREEDLQCTLEELKARDADLVLARNKAEEGTLAKSEFLAHMSHEIRTPMNGIIGMTNVALKTKLSDSQREYLTAVKTSADSLLLIINEILDFSKIEAGQMELDPIVFDFRDCLNAGLKSVALQAHLKDLALGFVVDRRIPLGLFGDPARIRQIVINLVGNALKFTKTGSVSLSAYMLNEDDEKLDIEVRVKDTGIGIPKDRQDKIFESFTQADTSTSRNFGGTGLGLTITALLVEMMGGRIWVESEVGEGSTFVFTMTLQKTQQFECRLTKAVQDRIQNKEIWVVSEEPFHRQNLEENFSLLGIQVRCLNSAQQGLEAQKDGLPWAVFADAELANRQGFDLLHTLHKAGVEKTALLLRTSNLSEDITRYKSLGIRAHLLKPGRYQDLTELLLKWLDPELANQWKIGQLDQDSEQKLTPLTAIVTDDNEINRQLARIMLEGLGCKVIDADSGEKVLEVLSAGVTADILFLDIMMPGMDGFECTERIRELESSSGWERLPIIALTAHALVGYEQKCIDANMDGYLSKPIDDKKMYEVLSRYAEAKGLAAVDSPAPSDTPQAPDPQEPELKVLDLDIALKRMGGNQQLLKTIIGVFLESSLKQFQEVETSIADGNSDALRFSAHTLKGTVLNFEARKTAEVSQRLEDLGRTGSTDGAAEILEELRVCFLELRKELEAV